MSADVHEEKLQLTKLEDVGKVIHAAKPLVYLLYSLIAGWVLVSGLKDFSPRTDAPNFMLALCKNQWPKGAKIDTPCGEIEAKVKNSDKQCGQTQDVRVFQI